MLARYLPNALAKAITQAGAGGGVWTPAQWFLSGEQGAWYDPSDMSTLFQDAAGTTPVTAVEQPVGLMLDKSGRGNHASQTTAASRPVLSARKNKLLATTTLATQAVTLTASPHTLSFKGTGTVTLSGASTAGPLVGTGASDRVSLTFTPTAGSVTFTVSGSVTEAQLEGGGAVGTYQRVTTATDYDTVGFPHYLKFDGVDDSLATAAINFTGTDKMTVVTGIRRHTEAVGVLLEGGNGADGRFALWASGWANGDYGTANYGGAADGEHRFTPFVGARHDVVSSRYDAKGVSPNAVLFRVNAVDVVGSPSPNGGGGNFGNYPLYIGRRGGTSLLFNGNVYNLIVRGAATALADIENVESFVAEKTGVTL